MSAAAGPARPAPPACGVCGARVPPPFRAPAPEMAPDLDQRPGEPARSTLPRWVATCRRCGAAAPDLARLPAQAAAVVHGPDYPQPAFPASPAPASAADEAALPFLRWAAICAGAGDRPGEREAVLQAAWAVEDAGGDAAPLRRRAAALWGAPEGVEDALRLLDVLRRAGDGAAALAAADRAALLPLDEASAQVLAFQRARLAAGDAGRHLISSALRPPSRTPHVTHGRARRGFWRALLGR